MSTINTANNWEYETITIPGDTSGNWPANTAGALVINFDLGSGTTQYGTANAWTASWKSGVTGSTSIMGTVGNNWYVTGIQLEKGSNASSFEYRPYGTELQLCQRYYEKTYDQSVVPGTGGSDRGAFFTVRIDSVGGGRTAFKVTKRATPTVTVYSPTSGTAGQARNYSTSSDYAASAQSIGENGFYLLVGSATNGHGLGIQYVASSEL